ncbi:unnamed protein product, partial [Symbiodinium sp. CCMP2456]
MAAVFQASLQYQDGGEDILDRGNWQKLLELVRAEAEAPEGRGPNGRAKRSSVQVVLSNLNS